MGQYERAGSDMTIGSDDVSGTIGDGETDLLFAGGQTLGGVGGIIDVNDNGIIDNGDYIAMVEDYTVNGNSTVTFNYPGDFNLITSSGFITVRLVGASDHNGTRFMFGSSGIPMGQYERVGSDVTITGDTMSRVIQNEGVDFLFAGGQTLGVVGGIIDVNGNGIIDNGDYLASVENYTVNGDATVTFTY